MRKLFLLSITILGLLLISCQKDKENFILNSGNTTNGSLSLRMLKTTIPSEIKTIVVILYQNYPPIQISDSIIINQIISDTILFRMTNIPVGNWKLKVLAKDSLSIVRYQGETNVTIFDNQTTDAIVIMTPAGSGFGNLNIYIVWQTRTQKWKMYDSNPVIKQTAGSWDANHNFIIAPRVIKENGIYKMWYGSGNNQSVQIAYATSSDGYNWIKQGIVLRNGNPGTWYEAGISSCWIIKENNLYKMWFYARSNQNNHNGIGYATSSDGINWNIYPNPVIPTTAGKPFIYYPSVVKKDSLYYLYYTLSLNYETQPVICLATSVDGINWNDHGVVLRPRNYINWEKGGIFSPAVIYFNNKFLMYYSTKSEIHSFNSGFIGMAESNDGINWTFKSQNPEISNLDTNNWQTTLVAHPFVFEDNGKLKMYFSGISVYNNMYQIGLAEEN